MVQKASSPQCPSLLIKFTGTHLYSCIYMRLLFLQQQQSWLLETQTSWAVENTVFIIHPCWLQSYIFCGKILNNYDNGQCTIKHITWIMSSNLYISCGRGTFIHPVPQGKYLGFLALSFQDSGAGRRTHDIVLIPVCALSMRKQYLC